MKSKRLHPDMLRCIPHIYIIAIYNINYAAYMNSEHCTIVLSIINGIFKLRALYYMLVRGSLKVPVIIVSTVSIMSYAACTMHI